MGTRAHNAIAKHPRLWYYVFLVAAMTAAFAGVNGLLIATGREGVWTQDAQPLYANFLVWACQAIDQAFSSLSAGEGFVLPEYTYHMGYGADVPMTMGSYLQDPLNLIVAALPSELIGVSYPLMTLARMILSAVTFSWYCFSRGNGRKATGVAAVAYATCGFIVFLGAFRHPKFIDWAILLPLILQGADRLFKGKGPSLFVFALFLQFVVSIYFSYMSCITVLVYCLVKYFAMPRERSVRDFALLVGKFLACGIVAFLVSGLFSLPQIIALLSQGRATSGGTAIPLFFTVKYYAKIAAHFIGAAGTTDGMVLNVVTTVGLLVFLFCPKSFRKDERRAWLIGFVLCFAGVLVPYLGHVMNGMGYSTDRWMLLLAFVSSYILCISLPKLPGLSPQDWKRVAVGVIVIAALVLAYAIAQIWMTDGIAGTVWPLVMAVLFVACFIVFKRLRATRPDSLGPAAFAAVAVLLCATLSSSFYLSPFGQNWGATFPKIGTTWANMTQKSPAEIVDLNGDNGLYRYTLPRVYNSMKNSALIHESMGIDYYTSYYNQRVDDFRQELGISDHHMNFSFIGSDSRLAIDALTGARYYVCQDRDVWRVPYGFSDTGIEHSKFHLFETENAVPLAFAVDAMIPRDEYEGLTMIEKQEALLQGAVVEEGSSALGLGKANLSFSSKVIPFSVVEEDGLVYDEGIVKTSKRSAKLTVAFSGLAESETYLSIENLDFRAYSPGEKAEAAGKQASLRTKLDDLFWSEPTTYPITASIGERTKAANPATPHHIRYGGKKDWVFNLCYSEAPATTMTIEFDEVGDYTFDRLDIICQPVKPLVKNANALAASKLDGLELLTNEVTATYHAADETPELAVFTLAYTPGWSATVDGAEAEVLNVDTAFIGIEVQGTGSHEIRLHYETPGVKAGLCLTAVGLVACVVFLVLRRRFSVKAASR